MRIQRLGSNWQGPVQCVKDSKDEGAKAEVVLKYCTCMNNKMDSNETQSITQWEKVHVAERRACDPTEDAGTPESTARFLVEERERWRALAKELDLEPR